MGKAIPAQHPSVVLRSHYTLVRALLAVAMIAVIGLTVAVVMLATDGAENSGASSARPIEPIHYGGFNPFTGRPESAPLPQREERATFGPNSVAPGTRYVNPSTGYPSIRDGGPE
jgi:hypothetical protein